jgi:hypothetical protein
MFMFPCLLSFAMFMLACAFALAGLAAGLGEAVTVVFAFALALLFEFSAVLQAAPKTAINTRVRKAVVFRIVVPPVCPQSIKLISFH